MDIKKLKCGTAKKFTVIKNEDIDKYFTETEKAIFYELKNKIAFARRDNDGKNQNEYLVINTDEPYAGKVIEIMKSNGQWG